MKSRVDEPDAEGPKDAAELLFGAPARATTPTSRGRWTTSSGTRRSTAIRRRVPAADASRDKLAELFGRTPAAEADAADLASDRAPWRRG